MPGAATAPPAVRQTGRQRAESSACPRCLALAAGQLDPVLADLLRQAEDALADDVLLDLARPGGDGAGARTSEGEGPGRIVQVVGGIGQVVRLPAEELPIRAEDLLDEFLRALVLLGVGELRDRGLRPRPVPLLQAA